MGETVAMTDKEIDRLQILTRVQAKELTQIKAAGLLKISDRQVRKLLVRLKQEGHKGLVSKHRGKPSNRRIPLENKQRVLALLREMYEGFGPRFASEKLLERHGIELSSETLRKWMIENSLWVPRRSRVKVHKTRMRRPSFGELIQTDGSPERWFGDDGPMLNLTIMIDDATSKITGGHFSEAEDLNSYFIVLEQHLKQYGRPRGLYVDRASTFYNKNKSKPTQMQRALKALDIELIFANSPQAKGRVERANRTLQDRLIKEMRLRGIKTIDAANAYLADFIEQHNRQFGKEPMSAFNAHRPVDEYDLKKILCRKEVRILNGSGEFHFNNVTYQVQGIKEIRRLNKQKIELCLSRAGEVRAFLGNRELEITSLSEIIDPVPELSRKEALAWRPRKSRLVPVTHPWKRGYWEQSRGQVR